MYRLTWDHIKTVSQFEAKTASQARRLFVGCNGPYGLAMIWLYADALFMRAQAVKCIPNPELD